MMNCNARGEGASGSACRREGAMARRIRGVGLRLCCRQAVLESSVVGYAGVRVPARQQATCQPANFDCDRLTRLELDLPCPAWHCTRRPRRSGPLRARVRTQISYPTCFSVIQRPRRRSRVLLHQKQTSPTAASASQRARGRRGRLNEPDRGGAPQSSIERARVMRYDMAGRWGCEVE